MRGLINVLTSFEDIGHCLRPKYFCSLQISFSEESLKNSSIVMGKWRVLTLFSS